MSKKTIIGIVLNLIMIIFEIWAAINYINEVGFYEFKYYTLCSNTLGGIVSLLWIILITSKIKNKVFNNIVKYLAYTATICLTVTFVIVLLVLIPMATGTEKHPTPWLAVKHYLFNSSNVFMHLLCPILFFNIFMFIFDFKFTNGYKDNLIACIGTLLYAIIIIILCLARAVIPPYPFLDVYGQAWYMSILWCIIILGVTYLMSMLIKFIKQKINN